MNTTIMYSFPDDLKYRYMSFNTYEQALKAIELLTQIEDYKDNVDHVIIRFDLPIQEDKVWTLQPKIYRLFFIV